MDPVPAVEPANVTEQLPAERMQLLVLNEPPVVPGVSVKVTEPVGVFEAVVVSVTAAVIVAVQLLAPSAMLQLTFPTLVDVSSFATAIVFDAALLPL